MSASKLEKLLSISSPALGASPADCKKLQYDLGRGAGALGELCRLLETRNGFLAFENALIVLPTEPVRKLQGVAEWNRLDGWRRHYRLDEDIVFFALDAFAGQFGVSDSGIVRFEPESGEVSPHSRSLEEWAVKILGDYDFESGWSVARKWQVANGPLQLGQRLLGRRPFVLGGEYAPSNLVAVECSEAMEKLGALYQQIESVPDGQAVTIKGWL